MREQPAHESHGGRKRRHRMADGASASTMSSVLAAPTRYTTRRRRAAEHGALIEMLAVRLPGLLPAPTRAAGA